MSNAYPSQASDAFYHALGWNDAAATCRRVAAGRRPAVNFIQLRETIERVAKLKTSRAACRNYLYGVEDLWLDWVYNEVNPCKVESPPDYTDYLPLDPTKIEDACDWCRTPSSALYWIFAGIAADHFVCSEVCGRKVLMREADHDTWLMRLRLGMVMPPQIDFMQPFNLIVAGIAGLVNNVGDYRPVIQFIKKDTA